jgi:hypothetical protein
VSMLRFGFPLLLRGIHSSSGSKEESNKNNEDDYQQ